MRRRFLGPVMLPVLLGASLAILLSPEPGAEASASSDRSGRSEVLKKQVGELTCLKRGDYQRMESERAKELDQRLTAIEGAMETLYTTMKAIEKNTAAIADAVSKDV